MTRMPKSIDLPYEASQDLAGLDLAEIFRRGLSAISRNLWILVLCVLVFVLLALALVSRQQPFYDARASIIIDPRVSQGMGGDGAAPTLLFADALVVDSEVEVLRSEDILRRVADKLDLATGAREQLAALGLPVPSDAELREMVLSGLAQRIDVEREGKTFVVRITAKAADPAAAADTANAVVDEYLAIQLEDQLDRTRQAGDWLGGQLKELGSQVIAAESRAEQFVYENDIPDENARNAVEEELASAQGNLIARQGLIRSASAEIATIDGATGANGGSVGSVSLRTQLVTALGGTPNLRPAQIDEELSRLRQTRTAIIEISQTEAAALSERITALKAQLADVSQKQVHLRELRREAGALQSQYEAMLARFQQSQGEDLFFRSNARVIERAAPPVEPANSNPLIAIIAATIGGGVVGLGLIFLREQLNDTPRSSKDVQERLGLPYLGALPRLRRRDLGRLAPGFEARVAALPSARRREIARMSYAATAPLSRLAETLRAAALELRARRPEGRRVMAVISAMPGEGKSFTAANLAFLLGRQGQKILIIDADTRNPALSQRLAPLAEVSGTGPVRVLSENVRLAALGDLEGASGSPMDALAAFLASGAGHADCVIIDTAPLAYVSDGAALAQMVDGAVMVAAWGRTSTNTLRRVLSLTPRLSEKIIGVCLSRTPAALMKKYEFIPFGDDYYGKNKAVGRAAR